MAGCSGVFRVEIFKFMGVSINEGTPIAGWFMMENPINMGDLVAPPFLGNLHIDIYIYIIIYVYTHTSITYVYDV